MNAVLSLSHFCETHGPSVLFTTQAFHFAGENRSGVFEPSGIPFFGSAEKLWNQDERTSSNLEQAACEACESVNGFITNDYQNKISFLSTRLPLDSNVSSLLKQAAIRSLSCEVVPGREGQIYFGDSVSGHVLSSTFFLKDAQARGFHRWYSILVFMKDKHFLLNSWSFFREHINLMVVHLQKQAAEVYTNEQNQCSQRAFRLTSFDQKHSSARSLVKLTASTKVFHQLHLWFTWVLSTAAKRLEEHSPSHMNNSSPLQGGSFEFDTSDGKTERHLTENDINQLKELRETLGDYNFRRLLYLTLIGKQAVVRGPRTFVETITRLLQSFLPKRKVRCQTFGDTYKPPETCNIIGLDLRAAVPMSTNAIMRLDIVPKQEIGDAMAENLAFSACQLIIKTERGLPEKLPTLLAKIDKAVSDQNLSIRAIQLRIKSLMEEWFHVADVIREVKQKQIDVHIMTCLLQSLGVQEQDDELVNFWAS